LEKIEFNEAWSYDLGGGQVGGSFFFDAEGKLTPQGHSDATETTMMIARELKRAEMAARHQ
jgi:hypothetical protein